eukprot:TRINITY_DN29930_c0_g1_i1.p1 TRINITY_DN29930_c0_g1~~TRINITY_DN29930_c0_g1_i1.p1  ORF type:complete len:211 (-),score=55.63 TRINITY_DN29930_c0_g1_i1:9-641(-)
MLRSLVGSEMCIRDRSIFNELIPTDGGCIIDDTADRAMSLGQLERVLAHALGRVEGEERIVVHGADGAEFEVTDPEQVNLYALAEFVIRPATAASTCSMVELMAAGPQRPDYFVSHWWGEPLIYFFACLQQHTLDRGLCDEDTAEFERFRCWCEICLLYTSDAADEEDSVDLGGRRIIKKKKKITKQSITHRYEWTIGTRMSQRTIILRV